MSGTIIELGTSQVRRTNNCVMLCGKDSKVVPNTGNGLTASNL